jgi:hypothetical protein
MRIIRILSLICLFAALFFGAVQLFNHVSSSSDDMSVLSLWQRLTSGNGEGLRQLLPDGFMQDAVSAVLSAPAWLAALCLGGGLWILDRAVSDDD